MRFWNFLRGEQTRWSFTTRSALDSILDHGPEKEKDCLMCQGLEELARLRAEIHRLQGHAVAAIRRHADPERRLLCLERKIEQQRVAMGWTKQTLAYLRRENAALRFELEKTCAENNIPIKMPESQSQPKGERHERDDRDLGR